VSSAHTMTPARILGELLASHAEAPSLLAEASHRQALAAESAAAAGQAFAAAQAARVSYEELRHRLDPRGHRSLHFGTGLVLLAAMGAILAVLDGIELITVLTAKMAVPATIAAMAVWLTGAWLAALGTRERHRALVAAIIAGAIVLSLILAVLHGLPALSGWPAVWADVGVGVLSAVLITVLTAGAAVLIARMEPASVFLARRRWQHAHSAHEAAAKLQRADAEAASVAKQSWLGLVRTHASAVAGEGGEQVVQDTLTLASALQEAGRPSLDPL
jgi:membrane-bound metal-dependent hydrolase YbcI (DUF457 family)